MNVIFIEEKNDKLWLYLRSKLNNFWVIYFIEIIKIVVVVNWVDGINQFFNTTVTKIKLESSKNIQIWPCVEVERYLQLLLIYLPLFVEKIDQTMENL